MKKQYTTPTLNTHGSVEEITQFLGSTDKNDFLFFNGSSTPIGNNGNPASGDGSIDGIIHSPGPVDIKPGTTIQGK